MLAGLGALLLALTLGGLWLHVPGAPTTGSVHLTNVFTAVWAIAGGVYLLAVARVLRRPSRGAQALWLVIAVAIGMRGIAIAAPPFLSSDLYRYVWDGRVQRAGINPYRYIPDDTALLGLRDAAIYPHVNRHEYAHTIYPPIAQMVFAALALVSQSATGLRVLMVGCEAAACLCVLRLLRIANLPAERLLIYAWNPLAVWDFAGNGHVDALAIGFCAAALLATVERRAGLAGAMLGAAIGVKFLPAAIAPALWRRWDWRLPAAAASVLAAGYACYLSVGWRVFGYLSGYADEESAAGASELWLLAGLDRLQRLPHWAIALYLAVAAVLLVALGLVVALRGRRPSAVRDDAVWTCGAAGLLAGCLTVAISPHYSWYFAWLAIPACLAPWPSLIWLGVSPLILQITPWGEKFVWPSLIYGPTLMLALLDIRRARGFVVLSPVETA